MYHTIFLVHEHIEMEEWTFVSENTFGENYTPPHSPGGSDVSSIENVSTPDVYQENASLEPIEPRGNRVCIDVKKEVTEPKRTPPPYSTCINLFLIGSSFVVFWVAYQNFYV